MSGGDGAADCGSPKGGRGRNAAATKQAILAAARRCFMQHGYEQVGVREIAAQADADPALVNRDIGSKEGLFAEAVATKFDLSPLFAGDRATLGERLARYVLEKKKPDVTEEALKPITKVNSKLDKELQELEVESTKGGNPNQ